MPGGGTSSQRRREPSIRKSWHAACASSRTIRLRPTRRRRRRPCLQRAVTRRWQAIAAADDELSTIDVVPIDNLPINAQLHAADEQLQLSVDELQSAVCHALFDAQLHPACNKTGAKQCEKCNKVLPASFTAGDTCPGCGIVFSVDRTNGKTANVGFGGFGGGDGGGGPSRGAIKGIIVLAVIAVKAIAFIAWRSQQS